MVRTRICRWGNSRGIRIPKALLDLVDIGEGDAVTVTARGDSIAVRRAGPGRWRDYPSLAERFARHDGGSAVGTSSEDGGA